VAKRRRPGLLRTSPVQPFTQIPRLALQGGTSDASNAGKELPGRGWFAQNTTVIMSFSSEQKIERADQAADGTS